jgi:hypothetical protein
MTDEERETTARVLRERGRMWLERALRKLGEGSLVSAMNDAREGATCLEACWGIDGAKLIPRAPANGPPDLDVPPDEPSEET